MASENTDTPREQITDLVSRIRTLIDPLYHNDQRPKNKLLALAIDRALDSIESAADILASVPPPTERGSAPYLAIADDIKHAAMHLEDPRADHAAIVAQLHDMADRLYRAAHMAHAIPTHALHVNLDDEQFRRLLAVVREKYEPKERTENAIQ